MVSIPRPFLRLVSVLTLLAAASSSIAAQVIKARQLTPYHDLATIQMPVEIASIRLAGKEVRPGEKITGDDNWLRGVTFTVKNVSDEPLSYVNIGFRFPLPNGFVVVSAFTYGFDPSSGAFRKESLPPAIEPGKSVDLVLTKERYDTFLHVLTQANAPHSFETAPYFVMRVCFENQPDIIWEHGFLKRRNAIDSLKFDVVQPYFLPARQMPQQTSESSRASTSRPEVTQGSSTPPSKFIRTKKPLPNHYIVVLNEDVVSNDAPLEVRRARIKAIAQSHAEAHGGKVYFIYETALKGYSIQLRSEADAIAISKLPQVRWVEQDGYGTFR